MTSPGCAAEPAAREVLTAALELRPTADGSPSLWNAHFGQAFHCRSGALQEARRKFVAPAQLERFPAGATLKVVETCVGLGYNTAALIEAAADGGLELHWWGLELDPRPLAWALAEPTFRALWRPETVGQLEQLRDRGQWHAPGGGPGAGRWWLGDARQQLPWVARDVGCSGDLVLHDAFSPACCAELWTVEFLAGLAALLGPDGRLITYSAAAAVRRALQLAGLELASIAPIPMATAADHGRPWSAGTVASPAPLAEVAGRGAGLLQPLGPMEREHLATRAAEPYRDPSGRGNGAAIQAARARAQALSTAGSSSAWRRRWGLEAGPEQAR